MKKTLLLLSAIAFMASCNGNKKMDEKTGGTAVDSTAMLEKNHRATNIATALALQKAFSDHDTEAMIKYLAADVVDYGDGTQEPVKGLDKVKKTLQSIFTAFPDIKGDNLQAFGEGDKVAVFGDWSGTFKAEMMGMKPTGKTMKYKDADLFTFNSEGKLTEHRSIYPTEAMMRQVEATMKK